MEAGIRKLLPQRFRFLELLRWGWVFLERTRILSGIQFTMHFIEFFVVETKRFVGSFVNVILTRQTCGQRSSRAVESKRWALGNHFPKWICYMFLMSKCRGDWDPGLCTTSFIAKSEPLRNGDFRKKMCFACRKNRHLTLRSGSLFAKLEPKLCTNLDLSLFYMILILGIANSLGKRISQSSAFAFRSPARALAAGLPRQDHVYKSADASFRFHNKNFDEMRCKLDCTENLRSFDWGMPNSTLIGIGLTQYELIMQKLIALIEIIQQLPFPFSRVLAWVILYLLGVQIWRFFQTGLGFPTSL